MRPALGLLLVLLMSIKVTLPVFYNLKTAAKEVLTSSSQSDDDGEKKTDPLSDKEKELASFNVDYVNHLIWSTDIIHFTSYYNHYHAAHSMSIQTPPPDFYL